MEQALRVDDNQHFDLLVVTMQNRVEALSPGQPIFKTDATVQLIDMYLNGFPPESRQHYNCSACRHFMKRYGGLVTITPDGHTVPLMWDNAETPYHYCASIGDVEHAVQRAKVTGVFVTSEPVLGTPEAGGWTHFAVRVPKERIFKSLVKKAHEAAAEKREDYIMLNKALQEFPVAAVQQAVNLLQSEALYRSEKCLGVAMWLMDLHQRIASVRGTARNNIVWLAVATAPVGFCHVRSSMIGTLLEDIVAGLPFGTIKSRFDAKMHPLQYQRPQAAPTAGNISVAERLFKDLKSPTSLLRRYARLDEVKAIWTPQHQCDAPTASKEGIFSHLQPKDKPTHSVSPVEIPPQTMTWVKFLDTVLPEAAEIYFRVPRHSANYAALVTAVDPDAPPIIQWDLEDVRNPVSWYLYNNGSSADRWSLTPGALVRVTAVCFQPNMWTSARYEHNGTGALFLLEGCRDTGTPDSGLFPEILKSELHGIRATIEAYSRQARIEGVEESTACGICVQKGKAWNNVVFDVTLKNGSKTACNLDRWD